MILAFVITLVAVVALCGLMLNIVIYAMPLSIGAALAMAVHSGGYGMLASLCAGAVAAIASLVVLQLTVGASRSPLVLSIIGLAVTAPAAFAGYHFLLGLLHVFTPDAAYPQLVAGVGAIAFGIVAWARVPQLGQASRHA